MKALWAKCREFGWVPCGVLLIAATFLAAMTMPWSSDTWIGIGSMGVALWIASSQGRKQEQRYAERKHVLIMSLSSVMVQANDECNHMMSELKTLRKSGVLFDGLSSELDRIQLLSKQIESIDLLSYGSPQIVVKVSGFLGALKEFHECVEKALGSAESAIAKENDPMGAMSLVRDLYIDSAESPLRVIQTTTHNFFSARSDIERGCYSDSVG